jgi:hypothetical protein
MKNKLIGIFICTLLIVLTTNSVIAYTNIENSSCSNVTMATTFFEIAVVPIPYLLPKYPDKPIGFDVKVANIGPNDCIYYEVIISIYEGWLLPDLLERLEPIYIFDDPENPFKENEVHDLTGIWSWTPEHAGRYIVNARIIDKDGYSFYDDQSFIVSKSRNIERSQSSQQSANSLLIRFLEQFPILQKILGYIL